MAKKVNLPLPPIPKIELTDKANWTLAQNAIENLSPGIQEGYNKGTKRYSDKLLRIIRKAIHSGTPPPGSGITWKPLKKGGHGIYYLTGAFSRAIGIYTYKSRTLVGMPLGKRHYGGLTYNQLAIILGYGNSRIPARPLFGPAITAAGGTSELKRVLMKEIRSSLIRRTGLNANQIKVKW